MNPGAAKAKESRADAGYILICTNFVHGSEGDDRVLLELAREHFEIVFPLPSKHYVIEIRDFLVENIDQTNSWIAKTGESSHYPAGTQLYRVNKSLAYKSAGGFKFTLEKCPERPGRYFIHLEDSNFYHCLKFFSPETERLIESLSDLIRRDGITENQG